MKRIHVASLLTLALALLTLVVVGASAAQVTAEIDPATQHVLQDSVIPDATISLNPVADTYVFATAPTTNYGVAATLYAGSQTTIAIGRALFRFDLSTIPAGSTVQSASFQAYLVANSSTPAVLDMELKRIDAGWQEMAVTWNTQPGYTGANNVIGVGTSPGYYSWDVTGLVQTWVSGAPNYGLALMSKSEAILGWRGFASRENAPTLRPQLVIDYLPPACTDPQEPNNTFSSAFAIAQGVEYLGCIPTPSDLDYFRFDVAPSTAISVELYSLPANYDLYLYAPDQTLLDSSTNGGTTSEVVGYTNVSTSGPFYAKVQTEGESDLYDAYALKLTLTPVTLQPDLVINDVWSVGSQICYEIENIGQATAPQGHQTSLTVDGILRATHIVAVDLAAGASTQGCFDYQWQCTDLQDSVQVCADHGNGVAESSETNNCTQRTWNCDTTTPVIVSGPTVSGITSASATVSWTTDEASDSRVRFGRKAGVFDNEETAEALTQAHVIVLTGLQPSATYHYVVSSADAAGNSVDGPERFFTTLSPSSSAPPAISELTLARVPGTPIEYNIAATLPTGAEVERLEFYMDGAPLGKAYAPRPGALPQRYEFPLIPAAIGINRDAFFAEHTIEAIAVGYSGLTGDLAVPFNPPYECADIHAEILYPFVGTTLYYQDTALPPTTTVSIDVQGWAIPDCGDVYWRDRIQCDAEESRIERIDFSVQGTQICSLPGDDVWPYNVYTCDWNAGGLGAGTYSIRVDVVANEQCKQTLFRDVAVAQGLPRLEVSRVVTRHDNYFEVALTLENEGMANLVVDRVEDYIVGFQPITRTSDIPPYQVSANCWDIDAMCSLGIDISGDVGGSAETLEPGERLELTYLVVPVLYPEADDIEHAIGSLPVIVHMVGDPGDQTFDRPCAGTSGGEPLAEAVANAQAAADYLIVTHPDRLFALYDVNQVDVLLTTMAELARLKNGVLGYLTGDSYSDEEAVRDVIRTWGRDMRGGDGTPGNYLSDGYLLIVGEVEVVASHTQRLECWEPWFPNQTVHYTDLPYGDTSGHAYNPELSVGRIIGNDAAELIAPIRASINVAKGEPGFEFDRSNALVVAGRGDYVSDFEDGVDQVEGILDDEFPIVDVLKQKQEEEAGRDMNAVFELAVPDRDVVHYYDHCGARRWGDGSTVVSATDVHTGEVDFGNASPFIFACCCKAGRYEDKAESGIAEEFLHHGAVNYVGAVEDAYLYASEDACPDFYDRWVGTTKSMGKALRDVKRAQDGYMQDMWAAQFNLYGDPKYGGPDVVAKTVARKAAAPPPYSYSLTVPDYQVRQVEGQDHVAIPGGSLVLQIGQPAVPDYAANLVIPASYQVQNVTLVQRSGLVTGTGLQIPIVTAAILGAAAESEVKTAPGGAGLWPEETFTWSVEGAPDGTSVLTIRVYPFYYNAATTDSLFYKSYSFGIQSVASAMDISALTTDKRTYAQGDPVQVGLWVTNTGTLPNAIIGAVVESQSSGDVVGGLLLRTLHDVESLAFFSEQWDSTGYAPGDYTIKAELRDEAGNVLDRADESFAIGVTAGEIAAFTVTPTLFDIGDPVALSLTFANTGTVPISGTAVIQIQTDMGEIVQEFSHDYADLAPADDLTFAAAWDTLGAARRSYRVVAYVLYESTATEPSVVSVRARQRLYLPLILRRSA